MISKSTLVSEIKKVSKQVETLKNNYKRMPVNEQFENEFLVFAGVGSNLLSEPRKPLWYINCGAVRVGGINYREDLEAKVFDKNDLKELYKAILCTKGGEFSLKMAKEGTMTFDQATKRGLITLRDYSKHKPHHTDCNDDNIISPHWRMLINENCNRYFIRNIIWNITY